MSSGNEQLAGAMEEATQAGEITPPSRLIALIGGLENSLQALQNMDRANELFNALDEEFGFIRFSFLVNAPIPAAQIQPADRTRYASLIRWLIRELRSWRRVDDLRQDKLVAAFIVAQRCDSGNGLWSLMPDETGENIDLLDHLKRLIASFAVTFDTQPGTQVPIWEGEAVDKFQRADADGDWAAIIRGWEQVRHQFFFANTLQIQTVRLLYRYSGDRLIEGVANLRQTPVTMQIVGVLTIEQRVYLAISSDNPHVQISSLYRTLSGDRGPQNLSEVDRELLTKLLLKVSTDTSHWAEWMKIFVGYPALQMPLGRALASVPEAALDGYVNSIRLFPWTIEYNASRLLVAECLREFRAHAPLERRKALWSRAHERWRDWHFGCGDSNQHLTAINRSDLDYAVVGYAIECLDEAGRDNALQAVRAEVQSLELHWHQSVTDILTSWYRLVSRFQPYAHATSVVVHDEDWLPMGRVYFLFEPSQNKYLLMMYNMTWPPVVMRQLPN
jgi:hypothetical protein